MRPNPPAPPAIVNAAVSTAATDNIAAINAAITTAALSGTGLVLLPPGTYQIAPTASSWIVLKSGVTLQGAGPSTVLKVKDDAGDYGQVISATTTGTAVSRITIRDLRIDQNPAGNTTQDIKNATPSMAVRFDSATQLRIANVEFDECCGVNTVSVNGTACRDFTLANCRFNFNQGTAVTANYDNSAVYFNGQGAVVTGNSFKAAAIADMARGAVELHTGKATMTGNTVENFQTICNVVTASSGTDLNPNEIIVANNTLLNGNNGVTLWPLTGYTLRGVLVAHNVIHLAQSDWDQAACWGVGTNRDSGSGGSLDGIEIAHNLIRFQAGDTRATTAGAVALAYASMGGIFLGGRGSLANAKVVGNTVINAPVYGIRFGDAAFSQDTIGGRVANNLVVDAGGNSSLAAGARTALSVQGATVRSVVIEGNTALDTGNPSLTGSLWVTTNSITTNGGGNLLRNNERYGVSGTLSQSVDKSKFPDLCGRATFDFASISAGASATTTITVSGATTSDMVIVTAAGGIASGLIPTAYVSANDTVTLRLFNPTAGAIDPGNTVYRARVFRMEVDA